MRIARVVVEGAAGYAVLEGDDGTFLDDPLTLPGSGATVRPSGHRFPLSAARLLAPVQPRTVVGMAHNTGRGDRELPPQAFLKPAGSVTGPGERYRCRRTSGAWTSRASWRS